MNAPMPFVCVHADPRCEDDPCPWGIARTLCNAPADHPARRTMAAMKKAALCTAPEHGMDE